MKPAIKWFLILLIPGVAGCQKMSDSKERLSQLLMLSATAVKISQTGGGVLKAPSMSLSVPQGALEEDTTITYTETGVPEARDSVVPIQAAYSFGPEGLQFNKPATLKICYDPNAAQAQGLQEKTMQIQYRNPDTGEFISMGGEVDLANHCVSASIYHFSSYILTAQVLAAGNNAPTIGGAQLFPSTPIAGLPLTVRSTITDWDGGSAVATVRFFYRTTGSAGAFKSVAMVPDSNDGTGQFYTAKVPGSDITAAGLQYYIEAFDSLNAGRTNPAGAPASYITTAGDNPDATAPIRFQVPITRMSAGFARDLTLQVKGASAATYFPVPADTLTVTGNKGTASRPTWLSARFMTTKIGTADLQATYGTLSLSVPITVYPGVMNRMVLFKNDVALEAPPAIAFEANGGSVTQLDAAGYDAYDNFMFVQPVFTASVDIGSFGDAANYGKFNAANVFPDKSGTITATLGGSSITYNVLVHTTFVVCRFDTGMFDSACVLN